MEPIQQIKLPASVKLSPETEAKLQEQVGETIKKQGAIAEANAKPFPGPLAEAFAPNQDIEVVAGGQKLKVRPFYDGDFDLLQLLDHPLVKVAAGAKDWGTTFEDIRGMDAKVLCLILTTPVEQMLDVEHDDLNQLKTRAKKQCSRYQIRDFYEVLSAAFTQFNRYWATAIGFEVDDGEGKKKQS